MRELVTEEIHRVYGGAAMPDLSKLPHRNRYYKPDWAKDLPSMMDQRQSSPAQEQPCGGSGRRWRRHRHHCC